MCFFLLSSELVARRACQRLLALTALINPAVGDAISDMLAVEVCVSAQRSCVYSPRCIRMLRKIHVRKGSSIAGTVARHVSHDPYMCVCVCVCCALGRFHQCPGVLSSITTRILAWHLHAHRVPLLGHEYGSDNVACIRRCLLFRGGLWPSGQPCTLICLHG